MTGSSSVSFLAAADEGGGAALDQVIGVSVVALLVTVALLWIGYLHRMRRITKTERNGLHASAYRTLKGAEPR